MAHWTLVRAGAISEICSPKMTALFRGQYFGVAFDVSLWAGAHVFCNPVSNCFGLAMLLFGEIFAN